MFAKYRPWLMRAAGGVAVAAAVALPLTVSTPAHAWWGPRFGVYVAPPVVVAPAPYYAPPPVVYAPPVVYPGAVWVAPYWYGGRWVGGYWRR